MGDFMSEAEFSKGLKAQEVVPWRYVLQNVIYRIENVHKVQTTYGYGKVLSLVDREGGKMKAYATSRMVGDLKDFEWGKFYIKLLGSRQSTKKPSQSYYLYGLLK